MMKKTETIYVGMRLAFARLPEGSIGEGPRSRFPMDYMVLELISQGAPNGKGS
jgi:hypothetical protein